MTTKTPGSAIPFSFAITGEDAVELQYRPQDIQFSHKKRIKRYLTRGGWVEEDWGDEMDRISGSGVSDAFIHGSAGVVRVCAAETPAYNEFLELLELYRNNGLKYDELGMPIEGVGAVYEQPLENVQISYRGSAHRGYFESFTFDEDALKPFQFSWSFVFVVVWTIYGY